MKNSIINLCAIATIGFLLVLGCSAPKETSNASAPSNATATQADKPVSIAAKDLTKAYDDNELAADQKYKGKSLAVSGKIENIAETFGNITVSLQGHNMVLTVMCSFEDSEKSNVTALKKGQQTTLVGVGEGMTAGLYVGMQKCKIQ